MLKAVPLPSRDLLTERAREFVNPRVPRPLKLGNRLLAPVAPRLWPLTPAVLKRRAQERTGLSDFGDAPLDEPLEILCRSFDEETELSPMGRLSVHTQLVNGLANRLRLEALARQRPEIFEQPVPAPIFIVGLPRSGTTFLQRLLGQDPQIRTAPFWEVMNPLPPGDAAQPAPEPDPRVKAGETALRFIYYGSPDLVHMHEMENLSPDEEIPILAMSFASSLYECMGLVPRFVDWYTAADHTAGYRHFRRVLQAMQWARPAGTRWILKAPSHLEMLRPLRAAFPDAIVVQTHRDPVTSVISLSSLVTYGVRTNFAHPNPHLVGRFSADFVERLLRAAVRDRPAEDGRFVDMYFDPLVSEPIAAVRRVYAAAGLTLTDDTERRMLAWIEAQRARPGRHVYCAADFNLDTDDLRRRFAFYHERFDVPPEQPR